MPIYGVQSSSRSHAPVYKFVANNAMGARKIAIYSTKERPHNDTIFLYSVRPDNKYVEIDGAFGRERTTYLVYGRTWRKANVFMAILDGKVKTYKL